MTQSSTLIDTRSTVNEMIRLHPQTVRAFKAFRVDSCCNGVLTIPDAARAADVDLDVLLIALEDTVREALA